MELWRQELYASAYSQEYLAHHGIKGQRWGVRRFQYEDGSLTPEGRARYLKELDKTTRKAASTSSERKQTKSLIKGFDNPIIKDFEENVGMEDVRKRLDKARMEALQKMREGIPEGQKLSEEEARKRLREYGYTMDVLSAAYKEIGREKVKDYLGSVYDKAISETGIDFERAEKLINDYLGFTDGSKEKMSWKSDKLDAKRKKIVTRWGNVVVLKQKDWAALRQKEGDK